MPTNANVNVILLSFSNNLKVLFCAPLKGYKNVQIELSRGENIKYF